MNRGPEIGSGRARNGDDRSFVEKASDAHVGAPPDWVVALAERADRVGLKGAGEAIGYSVAAVSQAIGNKYRGDLEKVAAKARGALLGEKVECPVLGAMDRKTCLDWQDKPRAATSSLRARMFRACRACPHSRIKEEESHVG